MPAHIHRANPRSRPKSSGLALQLSLSTEGSHLPHMCLNAPHETLKFPKWKTAKLEASRVSLRCPNQEGDSTWFGLKQEGQWFKSKSNSHKGVG